MSSPSSLPSGTSMSPHLKEYPRAEDRTLEENAPEGTEISEEVVAVDPDEDQKGKLVYSLLNDANLACNRLAWATLCFPEAQLVFLTSRPSPIW